MAAQPFLAFGAGDDDEEVPQEFVEMTKPLELGGAVDLNRMPELIDTLPIIVDETTTLFNLGNVQQTDDDQDHPAEGEEATRTRAKTTTEATKPQRSLQGANTNKNQEADASADFVFANDDENELFGGVIEMPEPLTVAAELNDEILFDSIVPNTPRIDQIMSQAPMMEIGTDIQESVQETDPEPLSINVQAGISAAILTVPALAIQQKHNDAAKQKQRAERRYHLPSDSTKKGG